MERILGAGTKVNPPFIINHTSRFPADSDFMSTPRELQKEEAGNDLPADEVGDLGATHRPNKRRKTHDPNEGVKMMLDVFEKEWEDAKKVDTLARQEVRNWRENIL